MALTDEDSNQHHGVVGQIARLDAIEVLGEQRRNCKAQQESGEEAGKNPGEAVSEDHAQHLSARSTDSHTDAHLCRALCDRDESTP